MNRSKKFALSSALGVAVLVCGFGLANAQVVGSANGNADGNGNGNGDGNGNGAVVLDKNTNIAVSSATGNSLRNSGNSSANNTAKNSANNVGNSSSGDLTINDSTPANQTIKTVPNVYAPGLAAAGAEVCLGSISAGGAAAGFGLSIGGTMVDTECQLRLNAKTLATLGYAAAAREEMCLDPQVRAAMAAAGTPCAADKVAAVDARDEYNGPVPQGADASAVNLSAAAAAPPASAPSCHKEFQLLGGWYDVCN